MDERFRDIERKLAATPSDRQLQLQYLAGLQRKAGDCVVQLVAKSHRTTDCGKNCDTYRGYEAGSAIHTDLASLNGFFDGIVANRTAPDHIPFNVQSDLLTICEEFCELSQNFQPPEGPVLLRHWPPYANCTTRRSMPAGPGTESIQLTCGIPNDTDLVFVMEAYVVPKNVSDLLDNAFYSSLDHFIAAAQTRERRSRRRRDYDVLRPQRPFEYPATTRGAVAALLVSRKTAYRESAIARYTIDEIEFGRLP